MVDPVTSPAPAKPGSLSKSSASNSQSGVSKFDEMIYQAAGVPQGEPVSFSEGVVGKLFEAWLKSKGLQPGSVTAEQLQQFANELKNSKVPGAQKYFSSIVGDIEAVVNELKMSRGLSDASFLKGANSLIDSLGKLTEAGFDLKAAGLDKLLVGVKNLIGEYNSKKKNLEEGKASPVEFAKLESWFRSQLASLKTQFFSNPKDPSAKAQAAVIESEASYRLGLDLTLEQAMDETRFTKGAEGVSKSDLQRKPGEGFEDYRFRLSKTFGVPLDKIPSRKPGETDQAFDARIVDSVFNFIQSNTNCKFLASLLKEKVVVEQKILIIESKLKANPNDEVAKQELAYYQGRLVILNKTIADLQDNPAGGRPIAIETLFSSTENLLNHNLATLSELIKKAELSGDTKLAEKLKTQYSAVSEAIKSVRQFFATFSEKVSDLITKAASAA